MYINCAHGKGIKFIRDELKFFAKTNIKQGKLLFKSVILFNADKLTIDAQSALRRCIEEFSHTTRFFIIVENTHRLLKPILSRFCNIYIPEPIIDNNKINLHEINKASLYEIDNLNIKKRTNWLYNKMEDTQRYNNINNIFNLVDELYKKSFSCLDIMNFIENNNKKDINKYKLLIHFDFIRKEFRDEKLLLLYILTIYFLRSNNDLENIEAM